MTLFFYHFEESKVIKIDIQFMFSYCQWTIMHVSKKKSAHKNNEINVIIRASTKVACTIKLPKDQSWIIVLKHYLPQCPML